LTDSQRRAADASAALVKSNQFSPLADGAYRLPSGNVIDGPTGRGLCTPAQAQTQKVPFEPFYDQANPGFCSSFKIAKNLIATAGHCITSSSDCASTKVVFGFRITNDNQHPEAHIAAANIYSCQKLIDGKEQSVGPDWRIIQVDRDIEAPQVELHQASPPPDIMKGDGVTVVGYPLGLPVKIADGATIRSVNTEFFVANLDTYEGNSGSAVFNTSALLAGRLLVEGILVRGENDFAMSSPCFASKRCPIDGCRGEDVTRAREIHEPH
jgi:V8-like Glu-specific endopeptidase